MNYLKKLLIMCILSSLFTAVIVQPQVQDFLTKKAQEIL